MTQEINILTLASNLVVAACVFAVCLRRVRLHNTDYMELSEVELCIELRIELRLPKVELTNVFGTIVELFLMKLNYRL